jgi:NADH-quinone oxidoreductase subunit M
MPGFSGFVAEFQVLIGAWQSFPSFAVLAGIGVVIGVAYTLRAIQKAFFSDAAETATTAATIAGSSPTATLATGGLGGAGTWAGDAEGRVPRHHGAGEEPAEDITVPERIGAAILIGTTLLIGLYPRLLLDLIGPALASPLFEKVLKGGGL